MADQLTEAGKKHSAETAAKIQHVHDTVKGMGAVCSPASTESLPSDLGIWNADRSVAVNEAAGILAMGQGHDAARQAVHSELVKHEGKIESKYGYMESPQIRDMFDKSVVYHHGDKMFKRSYTKDSSTPPVVTLGQDKKQVHMAYVEHPTKMGESASRVSFVDVETALTAEADRDMKFKTGGGVALTETVDLGDEIAVAESAAGVAQKPLRVKLISPGWGSSGYYPADVLERDGPRIFKAGTHMYMNHPTAKEEADRPEGDLKNLAAVLDTDAVWEASNPRGAGLYAGIKVFSDHAQHIREKGPHIGTSIRAYGKGTQGEREGKKGTIIEALTVGRSLDFVTKAGAGGQVFEESAKDLQESGQQPPINKGETMTEQEQTTLREAQAKADRNEAENMRLKENLIKRDARDFIKETLSDLSRQVGGIHDMTASRIMTECMREFPLTEDKNDIDRPKLATLIGEKVTNETEYLKKVGGKRVIEGMGQGVPKTITAEDLDKRFVEAFKDLGLSEQGASIAARG